MLYILEGNKKQKVKLEKENHFQIQLKHQAVVKPFSTLRIMCVQQLTISIFQGLFLLGGLGDDLDPLAEEDSNVGTVSIQHLYR